MEIESTIRAYQKVLKVFRFSKPSTFSEEFAQKRFQKKFEEPDPNRRETLHLQTFEDWVSFDEELPQLRNKLLKAQWYIVRETLSKMVFNSKEFRFPKGSEFIPTRGNNSLESRLSRSEWTCTDENFEAFSRICYNHRGLRFATRKRYAKWFDQKSFDTSRRQADTQLFRFFSATYPKKDVGYHIFLWKLRRVTTIVRGSRFTTVPKNNENRRPINVEPFGNIVVQSAIGEGIRAVLKDQLNIDLNTLQDVHRVRISDPSVATIDLKNASDSVSTDLCRFLLPKRLMSMVESSRSPFILGLDGHYRPINKISSMGNGFTFELMTLILTVLVRSLDPNGSVYGDDIIIVKEKASELIELLESVGFVVNRDKSFVTGPFRESCGANFHDNEGYVKSFDFEWPTTIHDCVMLCNKAAKLSEYPSFRKLHQALLRVTPPSLKGVWYEGLVPDAHNTHGLPDFFITRSIRTGPRVTGNWAKALENLCYDPNDFSVVSLFTFVPSLRSPTLKHLKSRNWAKYLMYLSAGRVSKDVLSGRGNWQIVKALTDGNVLIRVRDLSVIS